MAKTANKDSFKDIMTALKAGKYASIYFLQGEEPFFIDKISDFIEKNILTIDEQDMNLRVVYGKDTTMKDILIEARQYPFMAERRIVIVKEAQNLKKDIDLIDSYLKNPPQTTILVFCYKYEKLDGRKKFVQEISKHGVLFSSDTIYQSRMAEWITDYCRSQAMKIDYEAAQILADNLGNDLMRVASEIDKIKILIDGKGDTITSKIIEDNVGINRNFNNFELIKALSTKDYRTVFQIVDYFGKSPKEFAFPKTLSAIYNYFIKVFYFHLIQNKSNADSVALKLGVNKFFLNEYRAGISHYSYPKVVSIISAIRSADARQKGFRSASINDCNLLRELCAFVLA